MNCNLIFRLLSGSVDLLPDRLAGWLDDRWLSPHAEQCSRCRTYRRRADHLDLLFRSLPAAGALTQALGASEPPTRAASRRRLPYALAGGAAALAVAAALVVLAHPASGPRRLAADRPETRTVSPSASGDTRSPGGRLVGPAKTTPHAAYPDAAPWASSAGHPMRGQKAPERLATTERHEQAATPVPDDLYLDGRDPHLTAHWLAGNAADRQVLEWAQRRIPPMQDDFVRIRLPQLASTDPHSPAAAEAAQQYEKEAKVVDSRLFKNVSFASKAISLEEACASLTKQTGVRLEASRGVRDEKVTLFIKEKPARDVMRGIVRLFGLFWARSGEEGSYHYELVQDLRGQLAEQEMRERDLRASLLALDEKMTGYGPLLNLSYDEAKAREQKATGAEKAQLGQFVANWGAIQLYNHLSPADRAALMDGQNIEYAPDAQNPDRRLPGEWRHSLLEASYLHLGQFIPGGPTSIAAFYSGTPLTDVAGSQPWISLHIDRSETGQLRLQYEYGAYVEGHDEYGRGGYGTVNPAAVGESPLVAHPENEKANAVLRGQTPFNSAVTLEPVHVCAETKEDREAQATRLGNPSYHVDENGEMGTGPEPPHAVAADVWEAVHRVSGLDVIADAYSRRFALAALTYKKVPLFDALCRAGDTLHARWRKDGDFLLCRSTSFYWDKLKEVPNRFLRRWQADRAQEGGVPVDDVLEMAGMNEAQLDSAIIGRAIERCWGLSEWGIVANTGFKVGIAPTEVRPYARVLAELPPLMRRPAFQSEGMGFEQLPRPQQEELTKLLLKRGFKPEILQCFRFHFDYIPTGWFVWHPILPSQDRFEEARKWPLVYGRTKEETLVAARKLFPAAAMDQIKYSLGVLSFRWQAANGEHLELGGPLIGFSLKQD